MKITAELEFIFKEGPRVIEVDFKEKEDIDKTPEGKVVVLYFNDQSQWTGFFVSAEDDEIIISSLENDQTIGLPKNRLVEFIEEV